MMTTVQKKDRAAITVRSGFRLGGFRQLRSSLRFAAVCACLAMPAAGQTFEDAVRSDTALAFANCLRVMIDRTRPFDTFGSSGFAYRAIDRGTNDFGIALGLDHYFEAPEDTAKAEVDTPDGIAGICTVTTTHLSEAGLTQIVLQVLAQLYPNARTHPNEPGTWIVDTRSGLPLILGVSTIGNNHRYEAPGTVRVGMSYPG